MTQENELDINNQKQNKGKLTHFNEAGEAHMVDVHAKDDTYRVAKACGTIKVNGAVYRAVSTGTAKKGDVLAVARIAGIMGAKNNSMLIPLLFSGLDLLVNGVSDCESIDKAWVLGTGSPKGPFQILDTVGLKTAYEIVNMYVKIPSFLAPYNFKGMAKLLKKYIDEGKLGKSSGEGFYKY